MSGLAGELRTLRSTQRFKIFEPTEMHSQLGALRAHLLDLSITGALMHCAAPPEAGATVWLRVGGVRRTATVIWRKANKCGVAFLVPLHRADVDRVLATS